MRPRNVLITNDDSLCSPTLAPLVEELALAQWISSTTVVVPSEEQSWISQAITRLRPVFARKTELCGVPSFEVTGTPADCATLGIHNLCAARPDLVISGINLGNNAGNAFFLSSGTIGGAMQAALCAVPAVALSMRIPKTIFELWVNREFEQLSQYEDDFRKHARICRNLLTTLVAADAWQFAELFSINLPWEATEQSEVRITHLRPTGLGQMFSETTPLRFVHDFDQLAFPEDPTAGISDFSALEQGLISVCPINLTLGCPAEQSQHLAALFFNQSPGIG